jgi:hypothetical protein
MSYHSNKNRTFVRGVQGDYGLSAELERLRAMPRVRKANEIKFVDGCVTDRALAARLLAHGLRWSHMNCSSCAGTGVGV